MNIDVRFQVTRDAFTLNAEFSVPASGITAIHGPSGCGKTTLLRAVAGLEYDPNGYCRVGDDIWQQGTENLPTHQRPLGYVFQEASLFTHLDVRANLEYGLKRTPESQRRISFDEAVSLLGVEPLLDRRPDNLSGGERQRVAIARALLTSPKLLLMDEPLAALDRQSKRDILPYLERLHRELGIPVLYVSHSTDEVARLADHLVLMEHGQVSATGPLADMLARTDLPLAQGDDAEVIIEADVRAHDDHYQLTQLGFSGGQFSVARKDVAIGDAVRLRVLARDVSLALQPPADSSILNCLHAEVVEMAPCSPSQQLVRLSAGGVPVLARITRKSADQLGIKPGIMVYAQIKSVALLS